MTTTHLSKVHTVPSDTETETFNEQVLDEPGVKYYSYAGGGAKVSPLSPMRLFYKKLLKLEGENDGLVSWNSARWGTYLGVLPDDHLQQVNW